METGREVAISYTISKDVARKVVTKRFQTFWRPLQKMAAWLAELSVTDAAMENTGVYWWPVYHALAGAGIQVCVQRGAHAERAGPQDRSERLPVDR
jgi:hypothetical protein